MDLCEGGSLLSEMKDRSHLFDKNEIKQVRPVSSLDPPPTPLGGGVHSLERHNAQRFEARKYPIPESQRLLDPEAGRLRAI